MQPETDKFRVACIPDLSILVARLREATGDPTSVLPFQSVDDHLDMASVLAFDCTVVVVQARTYDADVAVVRRIRSALPSHPVIIWCDAKGFSVRQIFEVGQIGATDLLIRDVNDSRHALSALLFAARQRGLADEIEARLASVLPESLLPVFQYAIRKASDAPDVESVAAAFGISRRTLRNRLVDAGLPGPQPFLIWCRLLVAGRLLDEPLRTLDSVALMLDFSTGSNLGAALRRYVGPISSLRAGQVSRAVESEFRRIVQRGIQRGEQRREQRLERRREQRRKNSLPESSPTD